MRSDSEVPTQSGKPEQLREMLEGELSGKRGRRAGLFRNLLEFWDDLVKLADDESVKGRLYFLDDEKFPEVYFAYTLVLSGETNPAVFGNETNPQELLGEFLEQGQTRRLAIYEAVKKMIKEKYKRQHVYEI